MAYPKNIIGFISDGKGLPKWFKEEYVLTYIGLHDLCKSMDYIHHLCKKLFGEKDMKTVDSFYDDFTKAVKQLRELEGMLYDACKKGEIPEFSNEDRVLICKILLENKEIIENKILKEHGKTQI